MVSTGSHAGAVNLTGSLDSSSPNGSGGDIAVMNLGGTGAASDIALASINASGGTPGTGVGGHGGNVQVTSSNGKVTFTSQSVAARGGNAASGSNAAGGAGGSVTVSSANGAIISIGDSAFYSAAGGQGDGTGTGGHGGSFTFMGAVGSTAGTDLFLQVQGGDGGATGKGGDAGNVTFLNASPLTNDFLGRLNVFARGGAGSSSPGGAGGTVEFDSQVSAIGFGIVASGGSSVGSSEGTAGKVTTAGLTSTSTGAGGFGGIGITVDGTGAGMGSGTVTVTGDIVTTANNVAISAAGAVNLQDVTTTANGTGNNSGTVTVMAGGDLTVGSIDTHGDPATSQPFSGSAGMITLSGTNVMVGEVLATGGAGSTSNADGGKGGDITVTATAPNGRIDFGGVVDASGGARGGINRTDGAGGTITLTADFVKLDQTITTGLLDLNAPTVRLEGRLTYGSLKPVSASTKVLVGSVGTGSTGTGGSIQTAIDIAAVDATIMLDSGTFSQTGILIDKRVDIVGAGKDPANGGSIIESSGNINFTGRSGNPFDIITVTASGAGGMNTLLLQDFAVSNAILNGIVIDRGAATNTVGFVSLTNIASLMNGGDGLLITGAGMARIWRSPT